MEIKICIVDDVQKDIDKLKESLIYHFNNDEVIFSTYTDPLLVDYDIQNDLYFLDIDIPNKDGYHLAKEIYENNPVAKIIFCTMHDDFVFTSFQFNPFYFIRKSHLEEDIVHAVRKFKKVFQNKYLIYKVEREDKKILLTKIVYLESLKNYIVFHTFDNDTIKLRSSIKEVQSLLNDNFVRISNGIIVNIEYIKAINSKNVTVANGISFIIGRSYKDNVIYRYNKYFLEN